MFVWGKKSIICVGGMRNVRKVYVYDIRDFPPLQQLAKGATFCKDNQWGFEVSFRNSTARDIH